MPADVADALTALSRTSLAGLFRDSAVAYAGLNALHILAIALLVGPIAAIDLRLLGAFAKAPLAALAPPLVSISATGIAMAVATGTLLFSVRPLAYVQNPAFLAKIALVAAGVLNALVLRASPGWRRALAGEAVTPLLRGGALLSLAIWIAAVFAGRWIAFLQ